MTSITKKRIDPNCSMIKLHRCVAKQHHPIKIPYKNLHLVNITSCSCSEHNL